MAVIINEFEIVTEAPPAPAARPAAGAPPPKAGLTPAEVSAILERQIERRQRLRAH
jgi:hypothetical protein